MLWCEKCGAVVTEPLMVQETLIHDELDGQPVEKFDIPYCPGCFSDLDEADRCDCGEWKNEYADWCAGCLAIRDEAVSQCINRIRLDRKMELNTEQIKELILTYFE